MTGPSKHSWKVASGSLDWKLQTCNKITKLQGLGWRLSYQGWSTRDCFIEDSSWNYDGGGSKGCNGWFINRNIGSSSSGSECYLESWDFVKIL